MATIHPNIANLPDALREAVESLIDSSHVQGIVLVGSRSRGYHDRTSDYDLEVIVDDAFYDTLRPGEQLALVWDGEPYHSRLIGDTITESRRAFEAKGESTLDVDHWPYEAAILLYDRNGDIAHLVARLAAFPEETWEERLKLHYVTFWYHTARALKIRERDSTLNHALVLHRAAQAYISFIFVLNRCWPPLSHWAEQALQQSELVVRPTEDIALLTEALTTLSADPLTRLHDTLDPLLDEQEIKWHRDRIPLLLEVFGPGFRVARERWSHA